MAVCVKATKKDSDIKLLTSLYINPTEVLLPCTLKNLNFLKIHLSEIFIPYLDIFDLDTLYLVNRSPNAPLQSTIPIKPFSPNDIKYLIQKYSKQIVEFDLITATVVKCLPKRATVIVHLTHIYNSITSSSDYQSPDQRFFSCFAKILEKLIST